MQRQERIDLTLENVIALAKEKARLSHLNCDGLTLFGQLQTTPSAIATIDLAVAFTDLEIQKYNMKRWLAISNVQDSHAKEISQKLQIATEKIQRLNPIMSFGGEFRFMSNFYPQPVSYFDPLLEFPTTEHAYQAAKAADPTDRISFVNRNMKPGEAKRQGRIIKVRTDWDDVKFQIMIELVWQKFGKRDLGSRLLATENRPLIEGNWWHDNIWGICFCDRCTNKQLTGGNALGIVLMLTREKLRGFNA